MKAGYLRILIMYPGMVFSLEYVPDFFYNNFFSQSAKNEQLITAIKEKKYSLINKLLRLGVDINYESLQKVTPIMYAAQTGNLTIFLTILNCRPNIFALDNFNRTVLMYATQGQSQQIVQHCISLGCDLSQVTGLGFTPLHYAAMHKNIDCVRTLLEKKVNVNAQTNDNMTPLHYAAQTGQINIIELLFEYGADRCMKDKNGNDALLIATRYMNNKAVKYMLAHGFSPYVQNKYGETALMLAVDQGRTMIKNIMRSGNPRKLFEQRTRVGTTAYDIAKQQHNLEAVDFLKNFMNKDLADQYFEIQARKEIKKFQKKYQAQKNIKDSPSQKTLQGKINFNTTKNCFRMLMQRELTGKY